MITHQPKEVSYDSKRTGRLASRLPRLHAVPVQVSETGTDGGLDSLASQLGFERRTRTITDWQGFAAVMVGLVLATLALGAINALTGKATETQAGHAPSWQGRRLVARVSWGARSGGIK